MLVIIFKYNVLVNRIKFCCRGVYILVEEIRLEKRKSELVE